MDDMNILMLNYEYPPLGGGAGNATYYILKQFAGYKDLHIDLITSSVGKYKEESLSSNINIYYLNIGKGKQLHHQTAAELLTYSSKAQRFSRKLIKKNRYDICHAFFGIPCGFVAMKLALPYIISLRGSDVPFYNKRFEVMDKFVFRYMSIRIWQKAERVIANSQGLRKLALKSIPRQRISVIPNGVDLDEFKPLKKDSGKDYIHLISTGRLIERKGYAYLIKALKGEKDFKLTLIGDGDMRRALEEIAKENSVDAKFLGAVAHDKIPSYLNKADVFVLPSLNEGMSNSVLEAMACGLPIVATETGGSSELVNGNGFIVKKESVKEIIKALQSYKDDKRLIESHREASRRIAESMGWDKVAKAYYDVYNEIS
jgi:glycosyltransferase involved in cell wall biosynthesis